MRYVKCWLMLPQTVNEAAALPLRCAAMAAPRREAAPPTLWGYAPTRRPEPPGVWGTRDTERRSHSAQRSGTATVLGNMSRNVNSF
jgi:hypothetical protein